MADDVDGTPEAEIPVPGESSEDIEVVAHSEEEEEELNAGCFFNGSSSLA